MRKRFNQFLMFFAENRDNLPEIKKVTNYLKNNKIFRKAVFSIHDFHRFTSRNLQSFYFFLQRGRRKNIQDQHTETDHPEEDSGSKRKSPNEEEKNNRL